MGTFRLGQPVRFREGRDPSRSGTGIVLAVPASAESPQSYGVHRRVFDDGRIDGYTAWYPAENLSPVPEIEEVGP